jgi:hypothetical protein
MCRYDLPDPKCTHKRKGRVVAGDPRTVGASTSVCDRPECIADAKEWAWATCHRESVYVPDVKADAQGAML